MQAVCSGAVACAQPSRTFLSCAVALRAASWTDRWVKSKWKESDGTAGEFKLTAGKFFGDAEADKGIQTGPDSKFFSSYAKLDKVFDNTGKDTVVQVRACKGNDVRVVWLWVRSCS